MIRKRSVNMFPGQVQSCFRAVIAPNHGPHSDEYENQCTRAISAINQLRGQSDTVPRRVPSLYAHACRGRERGWCSLEHVRYAVRSVNDVSTSLDCRASERTECDISSAVTASLNSVDLPQAEGSYQRRIDCLTMSYESPK